MCLACPNGRVGLLRHARNSSSSPLPRPTHPYPCPPPAQCVSVGGYSATPDVGATNLTDVGYNCFSVYNTSDVNVPVSACDNDAKCAGFQVESLQNGTVAGCLLSKILVARATVDFPLCVYAKLVPVGEGG